MVRVVGGDSGMGNAVFSSMARRWSDASPVPEEILGGGERDNIFQSEERVNNFTDGSRTGVCKDKLICKMVNKLRSGFVGEQL